MTKPRLDDLREVVSVDWDEERAARSERGVRRRLRRRRQLRIGLAALLFVAGGATLLAWPRSAPQVASLPPLAAPTRELTFDDGSRVLPDDEQSVVEAVEQSAQRVAVRLLHGGASFAVTRRPERLFRVEAGEITVEVIGTRFAVAHHQDQVQVSVTEGRVRVRFPGGASELGPGQSGLFPPPPAPTTPAPAIKSAAPSPWRELARAGDYDRAFTALRRDHGALRGAVADLLLAADVARLSRHPAEAVAPLRRVVDAHSHDPRAPLAAFTLGRVLLDDLGRPREAAAAFARSQTLGPDAALAEDALAREVEAWSRAGDATHARAGAEAYTRRYPTGHRLRAVRRFADLD